MQHDVTEKCLNTNFSFTSIDHGDLSSCIFLMGKWNFEENILYRAVYWKTSLNGYIYMYILMMDKKSQQTVYWVFNLFVPVNVQNENSEK